MMYLHCFFEKAEDVDLWFRYKKREREAVTSLSQT